MLDMFKDIKDGISTKDKDAVAISIVTSISALLVKAAVRHFYQKAVIDKRSVVEID